MSWDELALLLSTENPLSAMEGKKLCTDFGIRSYFEMFQKMEDTFKFCVECKKLSGSLSDPKRLRRCKRCQNVYYCGSECQRANWPVHKTVCKKLKLVALDRLVEWLIFTAIRLTDVKGWEDWFLMQEGLEEKLHLIMSGRYMNILWANAGKPKPDEAELMESVKRVTTDFVSRPATIGLGMYAFCLDPYTKPITVHVVGASHVETLNARVTDYDELSRMFPKHQGIEVVMVGVDVVDGPIMRPPLVAFGPRGRVSMWVGEEPGLVSEQEMKNSLKILMELEAQITGCGPNPFASLKPEQAYSNPNKPPVYCNSHYIMFYGLSDGLDEPDVGEIDEEEMEEKN
ncbi:hypothetical protein JD844_019637 [Phrynosoma platyrhinos]|uniref:MYND-type domain-containing protein n=1 Tax=Phrynosoma platyrhinos TaxID=52577 RepID=A0ABQ7TPV8_PHRPL|nr:hypothetical protein JD844_019637 [Phrynosoma platyrhinos]